MRKTILFGLTAAMLATACSEEDDLRQGIAGEGITFTSSVMSRATDTSFEPRDAIGVSMYTESGFVGNATNVQYTTTNGKAFTSTKPMTWGAAGSAETVDFKGVYPYKADAVDDGIYSFTLATGEGASLSDNDVMYSSMTDVAVGSNNVNLTFKHKLVKVVMQVYDQNGDLLSGATVKINNQQTSGTLNLADGTVTSTGAADATLDFANNPEVKGEYQTIVMPSAATQGRVITITYKNVDYPCPVDMYAFESGTKIIFSATLNSDGTVSPGETFEVSADVTGWTEDKIESGWIFGAGDSFVVKGKTSYQLAENVKLASAPIQVGNLGRDLDEKDVYSLEYTRTSAETDADITISGKSYTLLAGQTAGTLLVAAGTNLRGINVSSRTEGITLAKVLVYSNNNIGLPVTLWTGDGTPGNGTVGDEALIARVTLTEGQQNLFAPGAVLRCYMPAGSSGLESLRWGTLPLYSNGLSNVGKFFYETTADSDTLTNALTVALYEEVEDGNIMIYGQQGSSIRLDKVELVPASDEEDFTNLLWCHQLEGGNNCGMTWGDVSFIIPASLKSGDVIRVTYLNAAEAAYLEGVEGMPNLAITEDTPRILEREDINAPGNGTIDFTVGDDICQKLLGLENRILTINGEKVDVHKVQLIRGQGE
ncbi:fimbrillin family protein [Phocaeicola plebeius]|uniref:fimbrillin family protein n=1 Tax=Phocaeicola plebeius TaxID=310297 RepID=UPI00307ECAD4